MGQLKRNGAGVTSTHAASNAIEGVIFMGANSLILHPYLDSDYPSKLGVSE